MIWSPGSAAVFPRQSIVMGWTVGARFGSIRLARAWRRHLPAIGTKPARQRVGQLPSNTIDGSAVRAAVGGDGSRLAVGQRP